VLDTAEANAALPAAVPIIRTVLNQTRRMGHYHGGHEAASHAEIARRLARLHGYVYGGFANPAGTDPDNPYLVPSDTLVEAGSTRSVHDLFGGLVPCPFVATKAISHGLVRPDAAAPDGWTPIFAAAAGDAVLAGYSVFEPGDARRAARLLWRSGPVRAKLVHGVAGRGQRVVADERALDALLDELGTARLARDGLVLEENLEEVTTISVGQVEAAGQIVSYWGTQRTTTDHLGQTVYGGSDLRLVPGPLSRLSDLPLPPPVRHAIGQACRYDRAADLAWPALRASRRNYDVAFGRNAAGAWRSGVLEQSWRIGGASGAEIAALEAFGADPLLPAIRASTVEIYGTAPLPEDAVVYFDGIDAENGPMLKYVTVGRE